MDYPVSILTALARTLTTVGEGLDRQPDANAKALTIALSLRNLRPEGALFACRLGDAIAALDASGPRPDWEASMRGAPQGPQLRPHWSQQALNWRGRELGQLILAAPNAESAQVDVALLELLAPALSARLIANDLQTDLVAEAQRADVGELTGPLIHEVTNLLNNLLLNLMVLEQGAGDMSTINLPKLRARTDQVSALIKEVQDYRRSKSPTVQATDINATLSESVELLKRENSELSEGKTPLDVQLHKGLGPLAGSRTDHVRCVLFLLKNAVRAARRTGLGLRVRSILGEGVAQIQIEMPGLLVPVESPARLYDTLAAVCPEVSTLELAASKSIARRFGGKLSADCPAEAGLTFLLSIPFR